MRYFIYARKSTEDDDHQILSIEAQLHELREFAKKEKLDIVASFQEAKTAKAPGRTVFGEMVSFLEQGKADGIISWNPDRLARNSVDGGKIIHLVDQGIIKSLKFPTHWFEPTPQGLFMLQIAFGQSKYYVDNLRENVKRGLRQKIRNGVWPGWAPPGYLNNPKTRGIDVDPKKSPLIKKMFELYATGNYTLHSLAEWAKDNRLYGNKEGNLSISETQKILQNIFYIGLMKYWGEVHEGTHEPLITKKLFDEVQRVMAEKGRPRKQKHVFPFAGLMKCPCGSSITAEKQKGHHYYRCTRKKGPCQEKHFLREENLIEQIRTHLQTVSLPNQDTELILAELDTEEQKAKGQAKITIQNLKGQLNETADKLEKLLDIFLTGAITQEEYAPRKQKLLTEKLELQEKISDFEQKGLSWLEPARAFVLSLNKANEIIIASDITEMTPFLKIYGSNRLLQNRQLRFLWQPPYNLVSAARGAASKNLTIPYWWAV